ncbi:radical SAM domain protein [delta proteobacterium NaphS2]|nr:radical SAM domain protein [delta proteobacterium NaphS2]
MKSFLRDDVMGMIRKAGLKPPKILTLMVTNGCNLACRHCWPQSVSGTESVASPVSTKTLKEIIRQWSRLDLEEICLTGGEPLTHPHWLEILRFACEQTEVKRVCLQTNATLLKPEDCEELAGIGKREILVQVSLEGNTEAEHDLVRGKGNFLAAVRGMERLVQAGLGKRTVVALTETRHNFPSIPRLMERLSSMGVGRLITGTLVRAGRSREHPWLEPPTPDQYAALLSLYHTNKTFRKRYHEMANIACLEWWRGRKDSQSETCACFERPYVTAEGVLYPCIMLPIDHLAVSGAHDTSLKDILTRAVSRWPHLPGLARKRKTDMRECKSCPGHGHCAGGCMGRAYTVDRDFMAVEDRCALRKAVYAWHLQEKSDD